MEAVAILVPTFRKDAIYLLMSRVYDAEAQQLYKRI